MSQPQPYSPQHAFVSDSATLANFPGQRLDMEFNDVKATTDQILANLKRIQRDDGAPANGTVTYDTLSASLQSNGIVGALAWVTATPYIVGAAVVQSQKLYRCLLPHTSGVFATDLAAGDWIFVAAIGNIVGPTVSVAGNLPKFHDTTGVLFDDSGVAVSSLAPLASPAFTGTPTAAPSTNTTQIATTAYADAIAALKANLASPTFTGTPTAPTASPGTNSTQLATTAYADAIAALKANLASPTFTGTPAAPTAAVDTNTTQVATTAMVLGQASAVNPLMNGAVAIGTSTRFARADHVHPVDTSRQAAFANGQLPGTATNDNATAGNVGEEIKQVILLGSAVPLTTNIPANIATITLTAGDWDIDAHVAFDGNASTTVTGLRGSISTTSGSENTATPNFVASSFASPTIFTPFDWAQSIAPLRVSLSAPQQFWLVSQARFAVSTCSGYGTLRARRVR